MDKSKKQEAPEDQMVPFWRHGWTDIDRLFDNMRRDFERSLSAFPSLGIPQFSIAAPSCDISDEGDRFVVRAEIPGVSKDEIKLEATDSSLEISAEHREEEEEKKKNYVRKERKYTSYHRILPIPEKIDSSKTDAKLDKGILIVELPKQSPSPKPKTTRVKVQ